MKLITERQQHINSNKIEPANDEIIGDDAFQLQFLFNSIMYDSNNYALDTRPPCGLNSVEHGRLLVTESSLNFSKVVTLQFTNASHACNYNYSMRLVLTDHPFFVSSQQQQSSDAASKRAGPVIKYPVRVLAPIKPFFINKNMNKTVQVNNNDDDPDKEDNSHFFDSMSNPNSNSNNNNNNNNNTVSPVTAATIYVTTNDINVQSDKNVELNCKAGGRPQPSIVWLKDGAPLNLSDEKFNNNAELIGSLKIARTHPVDSGLYECHVANRYGQVKRSFNVYVEATTLTIQVKEMTRKQLIAIILVSMASFVLAVLLVVALTYVIYQKREHNKLQVSAVNYLTKNLTNILYKKVFAIHIFVVFEDKVEEPDELFGGRRRRRREPRRDSAYQHEAGELGEDQVRRPEVGHRSNSLYYSWYENMRPLIEYLISNSLLLT